MGNRKLKVPKFVEGSTATEIVNVLGNKQLRSREIADQLLADEGILPQTVRARLHELTQLKILNYDENSEKYSIAKDQLTKIQMIAN